MKISARDGRVKVDPLVELREIYTTVDAAFADWTCESSTDCCRFGVTGREPYPTAVELEELERAVRARGGVPKQRSLPVAGERRCPLLSDEGKCIVYASRPFGCRTFFCERAQGSPVAKRDVSELARRIATLSERFRPEDPGPRPLSRAFRGRA
jgi:Fe-S-cluster containining protein